VSESDLPRDRNEIGEAMAIKLVRKEATDSLNPTELLALGSAGLVILAALLPWVEVQFFGTYSQNGLERGYGILTAIMGLLAGGEVLAEHARFGRYAPSSTVSAIGALVAGVAIYAAIEINVGHIGIGVWMTAFAGVGLFFAGLGFLDRDHR